MHHTSGRFRAVRAGIASLNLSVMPMRMRMVMTMAVCVAVFCRNVVLGAMAIMIGIFCCRFMRLLAGRGTRPGARIDLNAACMRRYRRLLGVGFKRRWPAIYMLAFHAVGQGWHTKKGGDG